MAEAGSLYEEDLVRWSAEQAAALRAAAGSGTNLPLDWENLAEEIDTLGRSQRTEIRSRLATIVEHLIKLEYSPAEEPRRRWMETIDRVRSEIELLLADSPSLRPFVEEALPMAVSQGARQAAHSLDRHGELTPQSRGALAGKQYASQEVLGPWLPERSARPT